MTDHFLTRLLTGLFCFCVSMSAIAANNNNIIAVAKYLDVSRNALSPLAYHSLDGGETWITSNLFPTQNQDNHHIASVACDVNGEICVAVGTTFNDAQDVFNPINYTTFDGGITWQANKTTGPTDQTSLNDIACDSSANHCVALGFENSANTTLSFVSNDAGRTWTQSAFSTFQFRNEISSLACDTSASHCVALGTLGETTGRNVVVGYRTSDGGSTWQSIKQPPVITTNNIKLGKITCDDNARYCISVASLNNDEKNDLEDAIPTAFISSDGGESWRSAKTFPGKPNAEISQISCTANFKRCVAAGIMEDPKDINYAAIITYISADGGNTWRQSAHFPASQRGLDNIVNGLQCNAHSQSCLLIGNAYDAYAKELDNMPTSYVSNDGGDSWHISHIQPQPVTGATYTEVQNITR